MSLIRGDLYVWQSDQGWHIWCKDNKGMAQDADWRYGDKSFGGVVLTERQMVDLYKAMKKRFELNE